MTVAGFKRKLHRGKARIEHDHGVASQDIKGQRSSQKMVLKRLALVALCAYSAAERGLFTEIDTIASLFMALFTWKLFKDGTGCRKSLPDPG